MKRNGFTLVEMMAVIVLVAVLAVIGVATYTNVNESAKQKTLESKREQIRGAALKWARENNITNKTLISVNALVVEGYLTADENRVNEIGLIENPVTGDNMICNTVDISLNQGELVAEVNDRVQNCELATQSLIDTRIAITAVDSNGRIKSSSNSSIAAWSKNDIALIVSSSEYDRNAVSISMDFEGNTITKNVSGLNKYTGSSYVGESAARNYYNVFNVSANLLLDAKVIISYTLTDGSVKSRAYTVRIDKEEATASVKTNNEWMTADKPIYVMVDDGKGSGPKYFYTSKDPGGSNKKQYTANQFEGTVTSLEVGKYYIWTEDNVGNMSSKPKAIIEVNNVDDSVPACKVVFKGTLGEHGWYKKDLVETYGELTANAGISGVNVGVNYDPSNPVYSAFARYNTVVTGRGEDRTTNTGKNGELYYCHAKTLAGNYSYNTLRLYLDRTPPTINITMEKANTHTQTKTFTTTIRDNLSGLNSVSTFRYGFASTPNGTPAEWHTYTINAQAQTNESASTTVTTTDKITGHYYLVIDTTGFTDYAGNYATPPSGSDPARAVYGPYAFDNTPPVCNGNDGSKEWATGGRTIKQNCIDNDGTTDQSGCTKPTYTKIYTALQSVWSSDLTIVDNAGNERVCGHDVYRDNETPQCNGNNGKSNWTNGSWTGNQYCQDGYSGCAQNPFSYTWTSSTDQSSITIKDNVGHTKSCGISVKLDTNAPTCRAVADPSGWTNTQVAIYGYCSDTGGSGCSDQKHYYGTTWYNGTYSMNMFADEQNQWHNPGNVSDNAGNTGKCEDVHVQIDRTKPSCGSITYGADSTSGVTASAVCNDLGNFVSGCSSPGFSVYNQTSSGNITIMDNAGNDNSCAFTVSTYTQYHTRTWNTCKTGNDCVGGYVWDDCASGGECQSGTKYTYKCAVADAKGCSLISGDYTHCNSMYGEDYWKCPYTDSCATKTPCVGGNVWDGCVSRTPCVGGWNDWSGWSNGDCSGKTSSTQQCETRTMYHGGS